VLTTWSTSLTQHQKTFQGLAKRVSTWDRQLVENSAKISTLYGRCFQAERDCSEVERQLTNVEHTQFEIEHFLDKYEEEVDKMMQNSGVGDDGIGGVDGERERTYKTAENCAARLTDLSGSLTEMVGEINATSGKLAHNKSNDEASPADPLRSIVSILNNHLVQLQKIGTGASELQEKVAAAQREARTLNHSQSLNGNSQLLESFGSSYLGRR
jgi:nuclear pore complex protein Nup62